MAGEFRTGPHAMGLPEVFSVRQPGPLRREGLSGARLPVFPYHPATLKLPDRPIRPACSRQNRKFQGGWQRAGQKPGIRPPALALLPSGSRSPGRRNRKTCPTRLPPENRQSKECGQTSLEERRFPIHVVWIKKTKIWSGRKDLNLRPHRPERCALPGCATPRTLKINAPFSGHS